MALKNRELDNFQEIVCFSTNWCGIRKIVTAWRRIVLMICSHLQPSTFDKTWNRAQYHQDKGK